MSCIRVTQSAAILEGWGWLERREDPDTPLYTGLSAWGMARGLLVLWKVDEGVGSGQSPGTGLGA